jgi:thioredoxin 2
MTFGLLTDDSMSIGDIFWLFFRSIPTLLLVRHGREIARTAGVMPLPQLVAWTRRNIAGATV